MKSSILLKTLSIFLATTALLQVSGISSKLVNGEAIVQANAATRSYEPQEKHIIESVEIQGNTIEGQTMTPIVKDPNGQDITKYCGFLWYNIDSPMTDPNLISGGHNGYFGENYKQYTLEKENIGKYIGLVVEGDYDDYKNTGSFAVVLKGLSTTTKVEPKDYSSAFWQKVNVCDDPYKTNYSKDSLNYNWYYLNDDGSHVTGWKQIGGYWYYFKPKSHGEMETGWRQIDGYWYCFKNRKNGDGKMLTGWVKKDMNRGMVKKKYNDKYYYLYSNGTMASNTTIDGHYLDSSGASVEDINLSTATEI